MKVLITGAAGFIGSTLVDRLLAWGHTVVGLDNFDPFYARELKEANLVSARQQPGFRLIEGDLRHAGTFSKALDPECALEPFDAIVHLAARAGVRPSIEDPLGYQETNVAGTQNLLEFARRRGVRQFVFASSSSVYGVNPNVPWSEEDRVLQPISPYASTKVSGELLGHVYSHLYGIRFVALRFFTVYGPRQRPDLAIRKFAERMLAGRPIPFFGDGTTRRDYTYVDDIVQGIVSALSYNASDYEVINLGNHQTVSLHDLVKALESALGCRARLDCQPAQPGDVPQTWADTEKAQRLLGFRPETPLATGLERFARWLKSPVQKEEPAAVALPATFAALPPPPPGRRGWPWTPESAAAAVPAGSRAWPRICLVTPSYNQGEYLEETIRSVLLQGYPNLEYHIVDGGSTDRSVDIMRRYGPWLTSWISERDRGQSDAINKGFHRCTGEIVNWLCSDDLLEPGALFAVAEAFASGDCDVVAGDCVIRYEGTPGETGSRAPLLSRLQRAPFAAAVWQPSCFFRRDLIRRPGLVLDHLHYCMDRELWCHLHRMGARWKHVPVNLSVNRFTGANKSLVGRQRIIGEIDEIYRSYSPDRVPLTFWLRHVWLPLVRAQKRHPLGIVRVVSRVLSSTVSLGLRAVYPVDRLKVLRAEYYGYEMW